MAHTRQIILWSNAGTRAPTVTLPAVFELSAGGARWRNKFSNLAFADGARDVSDGKLFARTVKIKGYLYGTPLTPGQYKDFIKDVYRLSRYSDLRLKVIDSFAADERYLQDAKFTRIKEKFVGGLDGRLADLEFELTTGDPYWYIASNSTMLGAAGLTVSFNAMDNVGDADVFLTVRVDNDISSTPAWSFRNVSLSEGFTMSVGNDAAGFLSVNGRSGDVSKNGTDWIRYFAGRMPRAEIGENDLAVYFVSSPSANTTVTVSWVTRSMAGP